MINLDLFEDDERQYINKIVERKNLSSVQRTDILSIVAFAREIANPTDSEILSLIDSVFSKVNALSDEEWNTLKKYLPFPVNIDFEDEIPDDIEEIEMEEE